MNDEIDASPADYVIDEDPRQLMAHTAKCIRDCMDTAGLSPMHNGILNAAAKLLEDKSNG